MSFELLLKNLSGKRLSLSGGSHYFASIVDGFSRFGWTYTLKG